MNRLQDFRLPAFLLAASLLAGVGGYVGAIEPRAVQPAAGKAYDGPAAPVDGGRATAPWHRMSGTVSNINHEKGVLTLKTQPATLRLLFPPEALRDLKEGDTITAEMAFSKVAGEPGVRAYDAPEKPAIAPPVIGKEDLGYRRLTGMVRSIDHTTGMLGVQAEGELFTLHFPTTAIRDLRDGDMITVHMAFTKGMAS